MDERDINLDNSPPTEMVMSVTGPLRPEAMGVTLPHEHIMSTFGADPARYPTYDLEALFDQVLPYLQRIIELGCQTLVDCTAAYFGRHPELLRQISQESGLQILTNTGYYGAADDKYVPPHAFRESADEIASRWTDEWYHGIDGTEVRPGFIKTAVDEGVVSEIDRKLLVAAVRTHLQTGLTIQTHTVDNWRAAQEILALLEEEGVHASAWIWIHANHAQKAEHLLQAAAAGAWISFDGINAESATDILDRVQLMRERGYLAQVLLSHDGDSYCGGSFRPYDYLFTDFIPMMQSLDFTEGEIRQMTIDNPGRAYTVRVRRKDASTTT